MGSRLHKERHFELPTDNRSDTGFRSWLRSSAGKVFVAKSGFYVTFLHLHWKEVMLSKINVVEELAESSQLRLSDSKTLYLCQKSRLHASRGGRTFTIIGYDSQNVRMDWKWWETRVLNRQRRRVVAVNCMKLAIEWGKRRCCWSSVFHHIARHFNINTSYFADFVVKAGFNTSK